MEKDLKGVDENTIVACPKISIACAVMDICTEAGYAKRKNVMKDFGEDSAYNVFGGFFTRAGASMYNTISSEEFMRLNTEPEAAEPQPALSFSGYKKGLLPEDEKQNLSGKGYSQFSCKKQVERVNPEIFPVMIPLDHAIRDLKNFFLAFDEKSDITHQLAKDFELKREYYAQQPQIMFEHINGLNSQIDNLKEELAIFKDLRLNQ